MGPLLALLFLQEVLKSSGPWDSLHQEVTEEPSDRRRERTDAVLWSSVFVSVLLYVHRNHQAYRRFKQSLFTSMKIWTIKIVV